jgi:hypothetical protein
MGEGRQEKEKKKSYQLNENKTLRDDPPCKVCGTNSDTLVL